jgi:hypothetical protein
MVRIGENPDISHIECAEYHTVPFNRPDLLSHITPANDIAYRPLKEPQVPHRPSRVIYMAKKTQDITGQDVLSEVSNKLREKKPLNPVNITGANLNDNRRNIAPLMYYNYMNQLAPAIPVPTPISSMPTTPATTPATTPSEILSGSEDTPSPESPPVYEDLPPPIPLTSQQGLAIAQSEGAVKPTAVRPSGIQADISVKGTRGSFSPVTGGMGRPEPSTRRLGPGSTATRADREAFRVAMLSPTTAGITLGTPEDVRVLRSRAVKRSS